MMSRIHPPVSVFPAVSDHGLPDSERAVDEIIAEAAAVAEEVAVHPLVVPVADALQPAVPLARDDVAAEAAVDADRRGLPEIPFADKGLPFRFVREHAGGADLHQVAAEGVLQRSALVPAEVHVIVRRQDAQVVAAGVITVEPHAAVAVDAPVHLVVHERSQVLVPVGPLPETVPPVGVAGHHGHILEMALAALVAYRAVVGVVEHEPFDVCGPELPCLGIVDGDPHPLLHLDHAGHDDPSPGVSLVPELLDRALAAGPHGLHGRVPAEVRQVEAQGKTRSEQGLAVLYGIGSAVDVDGDCFHRYGHGPSRCRS
jgi:hypothetical protein